MPVPISEWAPQNMFIRYRYAYQSYRIEMLEGDLGFEADVHHKWARTRVLAGSGNSVDQRSLVWIDLEGIFFALEIPFSM